MITPSKLRRIERTLKNIYAEVDKQALSLNTDQYNALILKVRNEALKRLGVSPEEYQMATTDAVELTTEGERILSIFEDSVGQLESQINDISKRTNPSFEDVGKISQAIAEKIIQENMGKLVKEVVIREPQITKETKVEQTTIQYNDAPLRAEIIDLKKGEAAQFKAIREEFVAYTAQSLKKNIDTLGMPDFRKLAMGLDSRIATLEHASSGGSGDVTGPASATTNNVVFFNGTTGKIIKDSGLTLSGNNTGDQTSIVGITGTMSQFDTAVSDGNIVYQGQALGTPLSGTATNLTGLPISTGLTGTGTGVLTALAINVGSAGAFVTFNGALGTPSSGTLTNTTGLPMAGLVASTATAIGVGSIELGHASDTTIARVSSGLVSIEGSNIGTMAASQVWTGQNKFNNIIDVNNAITASSNAATVPVTFRMNTVTNSSAATLTITMTTTNALDGQMVVVRILDFSAVAQTVTWVNTENSTITAPILSSGSTTLFLTVGFIYNAATSKWRCIASA